MAYGKIKDFLTNELKGIRDAGLYKEERIIVTPQAADIKVQFPENAPVKEALNFCANNYLGLSSHPDVLKAAKEGLEMRGYGLSSVRFICGTQDIHKKLERKLSEFLGVEDSILYSSCFDANGGLFEALMKEEDAIITEELNHASIIDGVRLSKAKRYVFKHSDMNDLEAKCKEARGAGARHMIIATDGVFSMDGDIANLKGICDVADKYDSLVMVDDSHATGFIGKTGRGTHEHNGVMGRIDVITTTLGKALGGASGGATCGRKEIIDILRQRSRPYLFSNTIPPVVANAALRVMDILSSTTERRDKLERNTMYFREKMTSAGFDIKPGVHPIVPIMLYNAKLSQDMAKDLYEKGIYVIGFYYPVVAKGQARIRVQISAGHEMKHLDKAIKAFTEVGEKYGILHKNKDQIIEKYGL
ncbi:MAG TPA: glycine C-acetyltransferase [Caldisericia bacterium]|nr:MAG: 2-amino-3-ketobutyrate coenzyme A ligase [bacterium ADurb.Bin132]HNY61442.1 glycine C-acetyltransferase [Caldisericia bacterium]HOC79540.1 glycine C-acetyltransferase [Caldisericia bacterium]HOG70445.1 glycine C-acetyltransferase [Caldisericia bacterium]HPA65822.1 glycine C-acetyltransferase [Caldisericia bacterium]